MSRSRLILVGTSLITLGEILLLAAAALVFYNIFQDYQAEVYSKEIVQKLPVPDIEESSDEEEYVPLYLTNPDMEMPTIEIDGYTYLGRIDIPALSLSLPVMSEWSYPRLKLSPCRYLGSAYQNNLVIAAHNYRSHFGNLKYMNCGDIVVFTDVEGNIFEYKVKNIEQLSSTDTEILIAENPGLTLITCTIGGKYRVAVRCISIR